MSERARVKAPRATRTSDVVRPRMLALSSASAALVAGVVAVAGKEPLAAEKPLARPHAALACSTCHGSAQAKPDQDARKIRTASVVGSAGDACKGCHGPTHGSTRAAHQRLMQEGALTCTTCHAQHEGAQGVTFRRDAIVRWGAGEPSELVLPRSRFGSSDAIGAGTTVPLVPLSSCSSCHEPSRASDPISACVSSKARGGSEIALRETPSLCFDEHVRAPESTRARAPSGSRGEASSRGRATAPVCASQHSGTRFVAWEVAREIASTTPWAHARRNGGGSPWVPVSAALAGALATSIAMVLVERRRRQGASLSQIVKVTPPARKRLPMIDPSRCLGCYACVDACPFDVLTVDRYVAVVARPEECCGVVLCEQVCPNGSLRIEDGEMLLDRPATDEDLESRDVKGLFIAGDLTGLPLIKNAIHQGVRAVDRIVETLPRRSVAPIDILVVGAGPAGLSAALRAKEKGLSCVVVEQGTIAASIASFPRDKIVFDPPLELPVVGELWLKQATKEELLAQWSRIVRARALDVREGHRVVDVVRRSDASFLVAMTRTTDDAKVELHASRVVLAIGRRGTPRALDLEIERGAEDRVAYSLADARSFEGKRVVVVGLGDSAMEAAIALARQPGTSVSISYRGTRIVRGKAKNVAELESLVAQKKVRMLLETVPVAVSKSGVTLEATGAKPRRMTVPADAVIVLIGGVPAWDLLTKVGIRRPVAAGGQVVVEEETVTRADA